MQLDPDDLAAAALDPHDAAVLPADADDRAELAALRRLVRAGRSIRPEDRPGDGTGEDPPAGVWDRIAEELRADSRPRTVAPEDPPPAPVISIAARRPRWTRLASVAAVVVLLTGAAGVAVWAVQRDRGTGTELVASTDLALLQGGGSGTARPVHRHDGIHLVVDVSDLSPTERADFYELWLLTPDGKDPQSLTTFRWRAGVIDVHVPAGMSTRRFPVVDISEEVDDGNPGHSGKSLLRGTLA